MWSLALLCLVGICVLLGSLRLSVFAATALLLSFFPLVTVLLGIGALVMLAFYYYWR